MSTIPPEEFLRLAAFTSSKSRPRGRTGTQVEIQELAQRAFNLVRLAVIPGATSDTQADAIADVVFKLPEYKALDTMSQTKTFNALMELLEDWTPEVIPLD